MAGLAQFCVDAGGTHCRGRLHAADGAVLAAAEGGPCNPSTDVAGAVASLTALWRDCAGRAGLAAEAAALTIGGAGLFAPATRKKFLEGLPRFARVEAMSDGYAALIGAGGGAPCALIIAGTGVVAHRLFADRHSVQRDGWGWIAGDRGSGAWLGRRALRHAFAAVDGLVPRDGLAEAVLAEMKADDRRLGSWLAGLGPSRLGALAPLVLRHAEAGEAAAQAILARGVAHLAALAGTLELASADALYLAGGLAGALRAKLAELLGRPVAVPAADALAGCLLVAQGKAPAERAIDVLGFGAPA